MALYPSLGNCSIDSALEIAVPNLEELVPSQNSRNRNFIPCEHREDLPCGVVTVDF